MVFNRYAAKRSFALFATLGILLGFGWAANAEEVTIYRDNWGVPYIYAASDPAAAYGLGYCQAEDRLGDLFTNVRTALGSMSEAFGEKWVDQDYGIRMIKLPQRCEEGYAKSSPEVKAIAEAFVAGVNAYVAEHPEKKPEWALELQPWHLSAIGQAMISRWPLGQIQDELNNTQNANDLGSNQWSVAASRSAENCPILLTDPHLTWEGMAVFYEANVVGKELEMRGFFMVGSPFLALGHNGDVGWAATTGGPDTADVYQMKLNPENQLQYEYDGEFRTAQLAFISIPVKDKPPVSRPAGYTHLGPLFSEPDREKGIAFVGSTPYFGEVGITEQFYRMCAAKNTDELREALALNHYMEQNIMFAGRDQNIGYVRTGRVPIRPDGYDWTKAVPGNTSATAYKGIHPVSDLVQIMNPPQGYMQNCNISPGVMIKDSPMVPEKYPSYIYNVSWDDNNTRGARALEMLAADDSITKEEAMAIAMDVYDVNTEGWRKALQQALDSPAGTELDADTQKAAQKLLAWDGQFTKESDTAALVRFWRANVKASIEPRNPTAGEWGTDHAAVIEGLKAAVTHMKSVYGSIDVTWGDTHVVGRDGKFVPVPGAVLRTGSRSRTLFNVGDNNTPDDKGVYTANNGSMSMCLMFFYKDRVESYTCIPWGQNADPASKHNMDQGEQLYANRKFKRVWTTREEIEQHQASKRVLTAS